VGLRLVAFLADHTFADEGLTGSLTLLSGALTRLGSNLNRRVVMTKWECLGCGYVYDPEVGDPDGGIAPGTPFEALPEDWICPECGVGKDMFVEVG
jgi:rubredoxin